MDGMKKTTHSLIHKMMVQFFICTVAIFALTTPLFYLLTKHFYAEDLLDLIESMRMGDGIPELDLEEDIMAGVMLQFLLIFAILSIAMYITVRFITRRLWHPFDDTLSKTEDFNITQKETPEFIKTDIAEFSRLNDSLLRLINKNRSAYRMQKEFTENASHELQTPLAVTRSKLDILLQEDLSESQYELVAGLYDLNIHMGHLNRNLLLLAKIENRQYAETEMIRIADFIAKLLPSYNLLNSNCRVVKATSHNNETAVKANPILLECLLNNLVANAIRHSSSGDIIVSIEDDATLRVSNPGDKALNTTNLFDRFRGGNHNETGTGLGLAIVKAICDFHGWQVRYEFSNHRHAFTVGLV